MVIKRISCSWETSPNSSSADICLNGAGCITLYNCLSQDTIDKINHDVTKAAKQVLKAEWTS